MVDIGSVCACTQIQTCPHYTTGYYTTANQTPQTALAHWLAIWELRQIKQWALVKHEPVKYYRPKPQPLRFYKNPVNRRIFARRVQSLNRSNTRNHYRRKFV